MMCEIIEQKRKVGSDKKMIEEDKRQITARLDAKDEEITRLTQNHAMTW